MHDQTRNLYAIIDNKAEDIIGGIQIHRHEAAAVRMYNDVANTEGTMLNKHPGDFDLVQLGHLDEKNQIVENYKMVMTGEQWLAINTAPETH